MLKKTIFGVVLGLFVIALAIQFAPYGWNHTNPLVKAEPNWNSPQTRELAQRACFDCHSNQTVWPWYSNIAPISWLVQRDVEQGRRRLNFSEWNASQRGAREVSRVLSRGEMPQWYYVMIHPNAKLSQQETLVLAQGLSASFALR